MVMAIDMQIEQRLVAVENAVRELQRRLTILPPAANWLERITGSFKDEPEFEKVLEYGRAIREADRPSDDAVEQA
jgi:hypothetical protein